MKKLITLCLALAGMVCTANADKRVWVNLTASCNEWTKDNSLTAIHYGNMEWNTHTLMNVRGWYGTETRWCYYDVPDDVSLIVLKRCGYSNGNLNYWNKQTVDISLGNSSEVAYKIVDEYDNGKIKVESVDIPSSSEKWTYIIMRNNIISGQNGEWNNSEMNTTIDPANPDKFTYELTKEQIDASSYLLEDGIRFRFHHGNTVTYDDYGTYKGTNQYPEIAPQIGGGVNVSFANDVTSYYQDVNSGNYWVFNVPTFNYEKLVFTADYSTKKWVIRVDAYISKTVSATYEYATFGTTVPVDLSGLAAKDVTAYTVKANGTTITTEAKTDALYAGEGVLLQNTSGRDVTVSIPVAASATSNSDNDLVAFTGTGKLTQPTEGGETYYILANDVYGVGFYKVNSTKGNAMGTNTAYLKVGASARSFLWFDESTGISETVSKATADDHYYNLNGQSVAQPTKGLYIVNGKKVIKK